MSCFRGWWAGSWDDLLVWAGRWDALLVWVGSCWDALLVWAGSWYAAEPLPQGWAVAQAVTFLHRKVLPSQYLKLLMLVKHYTCILYITICVSFQTCLLIVPAALGTPGSPTNIGTTHARQRWQTLQATFFGGVHRRQRKALEATNFGNCYFRHLSLLSFFFRFVTLTCVILTFEVLIFIVSTLFVSR